MKTVRLNRSCLKYATLLLLCGILTVNFFVLKTGETIRKRTNRHQNKSASSSMVSMEEFMNGSKVGNPLIDDYGKNNPQLAGENGHGVVLTPSQRAESAKVMEMYNVNTLISDIIPLNRKVPDSRIPGCDALRYHEPSLPAASIIIPFYNEWPSLLLRTVYSVINRSPRRLVHEIILVDDASTLDELKILDTYIGIHFPPGIVRLFHLPDRKGLIAARMRGVEEARGDVLIFFDSHMEVNIEWIQPLLQEVALDRHCVSMATLDYVQPDTFEYRYNVGYLTRYGFDWKMAFFETFFREDQIGQNPTKPRPGVTMVGAAFAIDREFFNELGGYDTGMSIWGGENLEMAWRVSLCGGRLVHVPCSRIGHVARAQPYSFPGGRNNIEHYNYKRALMVWAGNYSRFVYSIHPDMKNLNPGDLTQRYAIRDKLKCKDFKWYLDTIWPELNIYDENALMWGRIMNQAMDTCLDNGDYLFQAKNALQLHSCTNTISQQGFTLTREGRLRTSLQCVVQGVNISPDVSSAALEDCIIGSHELWKYEKDQLTHLQSNRCLDIQSSGPVLNACDSNKITQRWIFTPFQLP